MIEIGNLRTIRSRKSYISADAYSKGQTDGGQVGIHKVIGGDSSTQKTIG